MNATVQEVNQFTISTAQFEKFGWCFHDELVLPQKRIKILIELYVNDTISNVEYTPTVLSLPERCWKIRDWSAEVCGIEFTPLNFENLKN